ncbi:hypothetical protein RFI_19924 [Reticulomyxa filosa]|uniref:Cell division cycle protein 123 n=1 Tax=Reticulomyxa filosa TaxID=46433 RepID=X6MTW8_RETFI|nr:hypothetical protein RFI_19924 [Reticulomyxa filosa]|eukprot:ETO17398.1 hypothetical protein RFI_19924 [Reticulomyxa filosa]
MEMEELDVLQRKHLTKSGDLGRENNSLLGRLERKINTSLDEFAKKEKSAFEQKHFLADEFFVKLSTRSPKDATGVTLKTHGHLTRLQRIYEIADKLKVRNGHQAVELLSSSYRVFSDIANFKKFQVAFVHPLNIIIRQYFKYFNPVMEFRCFVFQRQLNAISQYLCYDNFDHLQVYFTLYVYICLHIGHIDIKTITRTRELIISFYTIVKEKLPYVNYVMDVFVDLENEHVFIVEINPFGAHSSSGSALFEWKKDFDILYHRQSDQNKSSNYFPVVRIAKMKQKSDPS